MRRRLWHLVLLAPLAAAALPAPARAEAPLTIFAAASLTEAMRAIGAAWAETGRPAPRFSFAASSTLARQIEQGAPADLFLSADEPWMDFLAARGLIDPATRASPIGNALVLVAPAGARQAVTLARGVDLAALLGPRGRLSVADPAHVPAGRYAQAAVAWLGQWDALAPRLARAENVRAALLLVERGEAPLGIVYATDALAAPGVAVAGTFPAASHTPITYPMAVTARSAQPAQARAFHVFLTAPAALGIFQRHGFTVPQ